MTIRALYSFPHKLGAGRICWTAWQQVLGLSAAGVDVTAIVGCAVKQPPKTVKMITTLARGAVRLPYSIFGVERTAGIHDWLTARWLKSNSNQIDVVHAWPLGALHTIRAAKALGIPIVLERPNCHTRFAYQAVEDECRNLNVVLPNGYEHTFDAKLLAYEEREYASADYLLCPSDFVRRTFLDEGYAENKLLRHRYGFDSSFISPGAQGEDIARGLVMIYAGLGSPRKGLHHALTAWLASEACKDGNFIVCGDLVEPYRLRIGAMLEHPSIEVLGHRSDLAELMKKADIFVLSSVEEGSALVTYEARGSGCVLLVSDATGAVCDHLVNGMIHPSGDVQMLTEHINLLNRDRALLAELRAKSLEDVSSLTWVGAGKRLREIYQQAIALKS